MSRSQGIKVEHPGLILKEEFLEPYGISAYRLSKETGINPMILSGVLKGTRTITPVTALKISKFFGLSERFWINLQMDYDLRLAKQKFKSDLQKINTLPDVKSA